MDPQVLLNPTDNMKMTKLAATDVTDELFNLITKYGDSNYIGEPLTTTQHMIQCAMLAEEENYPTEVVLGAFFHDIGHLLGLDDKSNAMVTDGITLGMAHHEVVGADYLKARNFGPSVCEIVRHHVNAKRYLVFKKPSYYENLSDASKKTLEHQGGPMSQSEADEFENNPMYNLILRMRSWDEKSKDPTKETKPLSFYKQLCMEYLTQ